MTRKIYTVREACLILSIGKTKLYELINTKQLRARKIGKKTIIFEEDLEQYINTLPDLKLAAG